jgi:hypothetical protein
MVIMAIDPSYNHFAYSIYVEDEGKIYVGMCSHPLGESIGFDKTFNACTSMWGKLKSDLDELGVGSKILIDKVISECPPPVSQFSAGLFALDTYMLDKIFTEYESISEMFVVSSSYLGTVHGGKYKKSDSTQLAKYFINEVLKDDFEVVIPDSISASGRKMKGTMNNDKAESFLFLLRMFCKYDIKGYKNKIMSEMSGLGYSAEKLLCSRI